MLDISDVDMYQTKSIMDRGTCWRHLGWCNGDTKLLNVSSNLVLSLYLRIISSMILLSYPGILLAII